MNTLDIQQEEAFLGTVQHNTGSTGKWEETLLVNGTPIEFKIDTGADVSVISESVFKQLQGVSLQSAAMFKEFAREYGFVHRTSSPRYPQANGEAERAVKTIKTLLKNADDPFLALLAYRATPLQNGYSPSELLMNRKLRTTVPMAPPQMLPSIPNYEILRKKEEVSREHQKMNFDKHHKAKSLKQLEPSQRVWISDMGIQGTVKEQIAPRSYLITTTQGIIQRNRHHLKYYRFQSGQDEVTDYDLDDDAMEETTDPEPEPEESDVIEQAGEPDESAADGIQRIRSGRASKRPI